MGKYKSLQDIDKDFQKRISEAGGDQEKQALGQAYSDARIEFLTNQLAARDAADAKRAILEKYPLARALENLITGADAESMEAQAKAIHDQFAAMQAPQTPPSEPPAPSPQDDGTLAYGRPGIGAGQPPSAPDPNAELFQKLVGMGGGELHESSPGRINNIAQQYLRSRTQQMMKVMKQNPGRWIGEHGTLGGRPE